MQSRLQRRDVNASNLDVSSWMRAWKDNKWMHFVEYLLVAFLETGCPVTIGFQASFLLN